MMLAWFNASEKMMSFLPTTVPISASGPSGTLTPGVERCYQYWYRNPGTSPCGTNFNFSNALRITWA